jgi:hypothetical protein
MTYFCDTSFLDSVDWYMSKTESQITDTVSMKQFLRINCLLLMSYD